MEVESECETQSDEAKGEPPTSKPERRYPLISSGLTVVGVACAAAYTSRDGVDPAVGVTAWIAVAVVGAAAMIAAARNSL